MGFLLDFVAHAHQLKMNDTDTITHITSNLAPSTTTIIHPYMTIRQKINGRVDNKYASQQTKQSKSTQQ